MGASDCGQPESESSKRRRRTPEQLHPGIRIADKESDEALHMAIEEGAREAAGSKRATRSTATTEAKKSKKRHRRGGGGGETDAEFDYDAEVGAILKQMKVTPWRNSIPRKER